MRSAGRTIKLFFRLYISVDTSNLEIYMNVGSSYSYESSWAKEYFSHVDLPVEIYSTGTCSSSLKSLSSS